MQLILLLGNTVNMVIIAIAMLLAVALLWAPLRVEYELNFDMERLIHHVDIRFLFFKKHIDITQLPRPKKKLGFSIMNVKKLTKDILRRIKVLSFSANIKLGLGDAYATAMSCGAMQTTGCMVLAFILPDNKKYLQKHIHMKPDFERECLDIDLNCIVRLNIANIIPVVINALRIRKRSD